MHISTMLVFWSLASLVRNSVVLAVYLLFSVACFFTVHEHLAMEYLGYPADRQAAENTRRLILGEGNPYYYKGVKASGIGSAHTPSGYIWHIAMAVQGLTSKSQGEKLAILKRMAATTGGKGVMHEGFLCDDDKQYTREWFSWANAMYMELFLDYLGYRLETSACGADRLA